MENSIHWRPVDFLVKGLALAAPWGVIELLLTQYGYQNMGFAVGLLIGLLCLYLVPPRETPLWRLLLIGAVICLLRPIGMIIAKHWRYHGARIETRKLSGP